LAPWGQIASLLVWNAFNGWLQEIRGHERGRTQSKRLES
jgi:hypothetical protein